MQTVSNHKRKDSLATGSEVHRKDVEGLRALAVGVVVFFHAGARFMEGGYIGVDVFFVISGFLITGLIVREMERTGSVDLLRFYARRIRRLLPASVVTLVAVAAMTFGVLPVTRWSDIAGDITWSSLYAVNWRFANQAVDYLAADIAPSPVQHFWSLAVEEQFYLIWPFLLLVVTLVARRNRSGVRRPLVAGLLAIAIPSLAWSVYLTQNSPGSAYFVTTTRMWELAVGGGVAILAPRLGGMSRRLAETLAVLGVIGILIAAVTYDSATLFPGYAAALPVLATAAVIAAGISHQSTLTARLLSLRPLVVTGGFSYAIYLWHWPAIIAADAVWGPLSGFGTLVTVSAAVALSWISYSRVEQPLRRSAAIITPPSRGMVFGVALTVAGVGAGIWLANSLPETSYAADGSQATDVTTVTDVTTATDVTPTTEGADRVTPAAPTEQSELLLALSTVQASATTITPDPLNARDDIPVIYDEGCHQNQTEPEPIFCEFGTANGPVVALVGDSHAAQWVPALRELADEYGFQLRTYTKSACAFADVPFVITEQNVPYESCMEWNELVMAELTGSDAPDLVVTSLSYKWRAMSASGEVLPTEEAQVLLADGLTRTWNEVTSADIPVLVIRDTPRPSFDVPECVVANRQNLVECAFDRDAALTLNTAQVTAAQRTDVALVDFADWLCTPELCPVVIDDLLVWRDSHHLTATYALRLAPLLGLELAPFIEE